MTAPRIDPGRLSAAIVEALAIGAERLPSWLREQGLTVGPEVLVVQALTRSQRVSGGQPLQEVDDRGDGAHMPLCHRFADAARLLDVSESTIKRLVANGELHAIKIGGCPRVPHDELLDFIARSLAA